MGRTFGLEVSQEGDEFIVWLSGELDLNSRDHLIETVTAQAARSVVLDLSGAVFIDSSGLGALVRCRHAASAAGRQFSIRGAAGPVARVLEITGLGAPFTRP